MAHQAEEERGRYVDLPNLVCRFSKLATRIGGKLAMPIGCKPADRHNSRSIGPIKNLVRLKDGLGQCLVDANTTQHLPLHGKLLQRIRHLYSE
jgi:hypothetical protein